jgi:hypothetical protein
LSLSGIDEPAVAVYLVKTTAFLPFCFIFGLLKEKEIEEYYV